MILELRQILNLKRVLKRKKVIKELSEKSRKTQILTKNNLILRFRVITDKLDGIRLGKRRPSSPQRLQDYLQLPDDYESRQAEPGKKHVSKLCLVKIL